MNATARALSPRALAPLPLPSAHFDDEHVVRTSELVVLLLDALVRSHRFSARERAILGHVLLGRSSGAIARALRLRETTVHKHMHAIFARTGVADRRRLFDLALRLAATQTIVAPQPRRRLAAAA
ncbi:MAG TPA: LuxR C-terminal-related transcriptional regulator [Enhygromyxa sp.]|nr:LuxR C-terminal-related transcriptional regulator [Enhygromyxa sp.]